MFDDEDRDRFVQPDSPEALKFQDGAKIVNCRICKVPLLMPMYSRGTDCGGHEPWRVAFAEN
jgi:hypothetical protein